MNYMLKGDIMIKNLFCILVITTLLLISTINNYSYCDDSIIKDVYPKKCASFIVSKPDIKIDFYDNVSIDFSSLKLFINYVDVTNDCFITSNSIHYKPDNELKKGIQVVNISFKSTRDKEYSFDWYFNVGSPYFNHYIGLLNNDINNLNIKATYDDLFYTAKYKSNLDFYSISYSLDNDSYFNKVTSDTHSKVDGLYSLIESSNKFCDRGNFIALHSFDLNLKQEDTTSLGNTTIFNTDFISPYTVYSLNTFYNFLNIYDLSICQFNSPLKILGNFNNLNYSPSGDYSMKLFEVFRGSSVEFKDNIISLNSYQSALDNGWHISPTATCVDSNINIGSSNEFRTVILAPSLTYDYLIDALYNMRTYAISDKYLRLDFNINGMPMGSILKNCSTLNFSISAIDNNYDNKIKKIQVISNNGEIIHSMNYNSHLAKLEFNINSKKSKFYYIKVFQDKNNISISAPIWIE